jgi:PAP2 superfamily
MIQYMIWCCGGMATQAIANRLHRGSNPLGTSINNINMGTSLSKKNIHVKVGFFLCRIFAICSFYWQPTVFADYQPGNWRQDVWEIPVLAGLGYLVHNQWYVSHPAFPYVPAQGLPYKKTSLTTSKLLIGMAPVYGLVSASYLGLGGNLLGWYKYSSGLAHSMLWTALVTDIAKNTVQEYRPYAKPNASHYTQDEKASFFSGHASLVTGFFMYQGLWVQSLSINPAYKIAWQSLFASASIYADYTRVAENKHHIWDVAIGSAMGAGISYYIFNKTYANIDTKTSSMLIEPIISWDPYSQNTNYGCMLNKSL